MILHYIKMYYNILLTLYDIVSFCVIHIKCDVALPGTGSGCCSATPLGQPGVSLNKPTVHGVAVGQRQDQAQRQNQYKREHSVAKEPTIDSATRCL